MSKGVKGFEVGNKLGVRRFCIRSHDTLIVGRDTQAGGNCKECRRKAARESYYRNNDSHRNSKYRANFGITLADYNSMFANQNGLCKGCLRHQSQLKQRLCVDHDHATGRVRGLLCGDCNRVLGGVRDSSATLVRLSGYIDGK